MPSETLTMVPWLRASDATSSFSIRCLMMSLISEGFSCCMPCPSDSGGKGFGKAVQSTTHRPVDDGVAGTQDDTTEKLGIHLSGNGDFAIQALLERAGELVLLCLGELVGRDHGNVDALLVVGEQRLELFADRCQRRQTPLLAQGGEETGGSLIEVDLRQLDHHGHLALGVELGAGEKLERLTVGYHHGQLAQPVGPGIQHLVIACVLERRLGIGPGNGRQFRHGSPPHSSAASSSSSLRWAFSSMEASRTRSAPVTARRDTWARSSSLARLTSCSISARAEATMRSPSTRACSRASSTIWEERLLACSRICEACSLLSRSVCSARSWASSRSREARLAASRPSAIFFWRS